MKRILKAIIFIIFILQLLSCAPNKLSYIPKVEMVHIIDLTKYSDEGFLITPESLSGKYESVGPLYCKILPAANREEFVLNYIPTEKEKKRGITGENINANKTDAVWVSEEISVDSVLNIAYETAISLGGNAIMEFSIYSIVEEYTVNNFETVRIHGYEIRGFVIKRLD
jgi:hypothetical protein